MLEIYTSNYDEYISDVIDYAWIDTDIEEKRGDELEEEKELIPLLSDINDIEGIIAEHADLNGENSKYLKYALININNRYYFFDVKNNAMELKKIAQGNRFICPYCKSDLSIVPGYERVVNNKTVQVDTFLRHYSKDEKSKECIFHYSKDARERKYKMYLKEGIKHKKLKSKVIREAKNLKFQLPKMYKILADLKTYRCRVEFVKYETKNIIEAKSEKKVLSKDNISKGYVPDVILYTDDGDEIYVEVTVSSGKMVSDYYDIWYRLGKTVIECKLKEEDIYFRYLYDPIRDKARKESVLTAKILADKQIKQLISNKIIEIKNDLKRKYKMTIKNINGNKVLVTSKGKVCESKWKHIIYKDGIYNRKEPEAVWKRLKEAGFDVRYGYKKCN